MRRDGSVANDENSPSLKFHSFNIQRGKREREESSWETKTRECAELASFATLVPVVMGRRGVVRRPHVIRGPEARALLVEDWIIIGIYSA